MLSVLGLGKLSVRVVGKKWRGERGGEKRMRERRALFFCFSVFCLFVFFVFFCLFFFCCVFVFFFLWSRIVFCIVLYFFLCAWGCYDFVHLQGFPIKIRLWWLGGFH